MERKYNKKIVPIAKILRKNMTKEEKHLWYDFLRDHKVKFTRQKVLGKYIADFYSADAKLVIELDGSGHYTKEGKEYDEIRTSFLPPLLIISLCFFYINRILAFFSLYRARRHSLSNTAQRQQEAPLSQLQQGQKISLRSLLGYPSCS